MKKRVMVITQDIGDEYTKKIKAMAPEWELIVGKEKDVWAPYAKKAEVIAVGYKHGVPG
jgi:hypothetical protein